MRRLDGMRGTLEAPAVGAVGRRHLDQLTTSGTPTPAATITTARSDHPTRRGRSLSIRPAGTLPAALAFDASGDLWVGDQSHGWLLMCTPSQLQASGTPTPATKITNDGGSLGMPTGLAFSPHAIDLPLH